MANEEKKAKSKEKRAKKRASLLRVLDFVKKQELFAKNEALKADVSLLTPGQRFGGVSRVGVKDVISKMFEEKPTWTEMELFQKAKVGRAEMRGVSKKLIRKSDPDNRKWIHFDAEKGVYTLVAVGPTPPKGWTGYLPFDAEELDIV